MKKLMLAGSCALLLVAALGCSGEDTAESGGPGGPTGPGAVLYADRVINIAHAGGKGPRPEHTMEAYQNALAEGADVLELDVHSTSDGVLVAMHDETVDRTTDGSGLIKEMAFADLSALDAGYSYSSDGGQTFPYRGQGLHVPSLEEIFEAFPEVPYVIEIKQDDPSIVDEFLALTREHGIDDQMVASAFSGAVLEELRAKAPEVPTSFSAGEVFVLTTLTDETGYEPPGEFLQVPITQGSLEVLTPELVERAHRMNVYVHAWTINEESEMRLVIDMGVDGVITDYPSRLEALLP